MFKEVKSLWGELMVERLLERRKVAYQAGAYGEVEKIDDEIDDICHRYGFTIDDIYKFM